MGKILLLALCLVLLVVLSAEARQRKKTGVRLEENSGKAGRKVGRNKKKKSETKNTILKKRSKTRPKKKSKNIAGRREIKGRAKKGSGCSRQSTTFCPAEKALALKLLYGQVANFFRQLKRAENHAKIVSKKKDKKENFATDLAILQDAVGGNISAPTCSSGRRSTALAGEKGEILANCSNSIGEACAEITVNTTLLGDCKTKMETYQTKVANCSSDDSCSCWTEATGMKADISSCKATDEMNRVKSLKSSCLSKFGDCKKAQDSAVELTALCPSTTVTTSSPSMTTMAAKHRNLIKKLLANNIIKH